MIISNIASELSQGMVLYLGFGVEISPSSNQQKVVSVYGAEKAASMIKNVIAIVDEANDVTVDWSKVDLAGAGKLVRDAMHKAHPDLDEVELDAIAWKFTFDWR